MLAKKYKNKIMERKNFHTTNYGWNYFYETCNKSGKIRVGRYFTNGSTNTKETYSNWFESVAPVTQRECMSLVETQFYKESR